jgi:hypothetical protein
MARKKHPIGKEYDTFTNLELKLLEIIINPHYSAKDLDFFKLKIMSEYVDHSNMYRLTVKYDQNDLTEIILNSDKFDINDGELYLDIVGSIMFGCDDRILKHLKNGYVPTKKELEGILSTYEEVSKEDFNQDIYQYFVELNYKIKIFE